MWCGATDIIIRGIKSSAQLADGRQLFSSAYAQHTLERQRQAQVRGGFEEFTISNTSPDKPDILQHIRISGDIGSISIEAELAESKLLKLRPAK